MDYQKKEQEKHYDDGTNKWQYVPTALTDPLDTFTPTPQKLTRLDLLKMI
jgi:hypothetical protein